MTTHDEDCVCGDCFSLVVQNRLRQSRDAQYAEGWAAAMRAVAAEELAQCRCDVPRRHGCIHCNRAAALERRATEP